MKTQTKFFALLVITALFFGCKKDDSTSSTSSYTAPSIASSTEDAVTVPTALSNISSSSPAYSAVTMVNSMATMANSMSTFTTYLTPPSNATVSGKKGSVKTYTWTVTENGETATLYLEYSDDGTNLNYVLYYSTSTQSKVKVLSATEKKDKSGGTLVWFNEDTGKEYVNYAWAIDAAKTKTITVSIAYQSSSTETTNYIMSMTTKTDKSGTLTVYLGSATDANKYAYITWNASGNGTYWYKAAGTTTAKEGTF